MSKQLNIYIILVGINISCLTCKPFHIYNYDVDYKTVRDNKGNYEYEFQTQYRLPTQDMGARQRGTIEKTKEGAVVLKVNGSFHFVPACDHGIHVNYTADENGYVAHVKQSFNRMKVIVDGKVSYYKVCAVSVPPLISPACVASLQGTCSGK